MPCCSLPNYERKSRLSDELLYDSDRWNRYADRPILFINMSQLCTYILESGCKCRNGQENQREESVDVNSKVMRPGGGDFVQFYWIRFYFGQIPWFLFRGFKSPEIKLNTEWSYWDRSGFSVKKEGQAVPPGQRLSDSPSQYEPSVLN